MPKSVKGYRVFSPNPSVAHRWLDATCRKTSATFVSSCYRIGCNVAYYPEPTRCPPTTDSWMQPVERRLQCSWLRVLIAQLTLRNRLQYLSRSVTLTLNRFPQGGEADQDTHIPSGTWCGRNIEFFLPLEITWPWVLTEVAIVSALQFSAYKAGCNSKALLPVGPWTAMLALQMFSGVKLTILILSFTRRRATIYV